MDLIIGIWSLGRTWFTAHRADSFSRTASQRAGAVVDLAPTRQHGTMRIRRITIERFRGIEQLRFQPGPCTVILGPNNAGKSAVLEALDLLLHPGLGRPRPAPEEVDYFRRDTSEGFEVEVVLGDLPNPFRAEAHQHLEGWRDHDAELVPEPDGEGVESVVRVRVRGTPDFDLLHEFAKPESEGTRFNPALRTQVGWVFDGRARDPGRQLFFSQGGLLERLFTGADLDPAIQALREALGEGAEAINRDDAVEPVLRDLSADLESLGLLGEGEAAAFEAGAVSRRALPVGAPCRRRANSARAPGPWRAAPRSRGGPTSVGGSHRAGAYRGVRGARGGCGVYLLGYAL